jgi:hypothetical protein
VRSRPARRSSPLTGSSSLRPPHRGDGSHRHRGPVGRVGQPRGAPGSGRARGRGPEVVPSVATSASTPRSTSRSTVALAFSSPPASTSSCAPGGNAATTDSRSSGSGSSARSGLIRVSAAARASVSLVATARKRSVPRWSATRSASPRCSAPPSEASSGLVSVRLVTVRLVASRPSLPSARRRRVTSGLVATGLIDGSQELGAGEPEGSELQADRDELLGLEP